MTNKKYISTFTMSKVTKLVRVVTYCQELPLRILHDPSMRQSYDISLKIKSIISPIAEDP